jgi:putative nucleotidyltransferase with HDIG domain
MAIVFGAATAAVLGVGLIIARGVTAPLLNLVRTASAVTEGDLTARSGIRTHDEVGALAASFDSMTERLAQQHLATIRALTSAIDARDPYTAGHSIRVGQLSVEIGRVLELPRRDLQFLEIGGYLHDIGKIGIRDSVLLKEASLTDEERALIEEHPRIGLRIVQHVDLADEVLQVVAGHHERLDGSGYPYGLDREKLTVFARISAVSDVFDALTTDRPYRPALKVERAVSYLKDEADLGRFDGSVVQALIRVLPLWGRRLQTEGALKGLSLPELHELQEVAGA